MQTKIAIIAGKGNLPLEIINKCILQKIPYFIVAINGETPKEWVKDHPHEWFGFGEITKLISCLKQENVKNIILAGGIAKPNFSNLKLDQDGFKLLKEIAKNKIFGDNSILTIVIKFFENHNFKVLGAHEFLENIILPVGILTRKQPSELDLEDILIGQEALRTLSPLDIGQAIIVENKIIIAVEAVEGTDNMIKRSKEFKKNSLLGVLVKLPKINQDLRADLPTIGPETVKLAAEIGLSGIAIQALKTIILNKEETILLANNLNLFITVI